MDSAVLRDAYVCIFNSLANLNVAEKKKKQREPVGGYVFVRLDFFF